MKKSRLILIIIVIVLIIGLIFYIINDKDMMNKIDNYSYNLFKIHINNKDTEINKNKVIKIAKNKNYKDSVFYPYYELLTDDEKKVYDELLDAVKKYKELLIPSVEINSNELNDVYNALMYDHPELFWLDTKYSCICDESNLVLKIFINYTNVIKKINVARNEFDKEVDKIVDEAKKYKTDYEKELFVHDTLINKISYDSDEEDDQSAYQALVVGKAVCVGYSKAFQVVMNKLGIPAYYIVGEIDENHAWNLIELEDGFYNIDLTFDDGNDRIYYKYFNVNEQMITKDHKREGLSIKIVKANGKKYLNTLSTTK